MKIEQYERLLELGYNKPKPTLKDFSFVFRLLYSNRFDDISNLNKTTIGTILNCGKCKNIKELFNTINEDLKLKFLTSNDKTLLIILWSDRIVKIQKMFTDIQSKYISNSKYKDVWNKVDRLFNVPVEISLIDSLSKRNNISWEESSKINWSIVYFQLLIDKQSQVYQEEINKVNAK